MRHEMLTQRALFCHRANTKRGTLSQHFVMHVVSPLGISWPLCRGWVGLGKPIMKEHISWETLLQSTSEADRQEHPKVQDIHNNLHS